MTTLALIDLSAIFWRNFMSQKDGDPASAPHDWTVGRVRRIAEESEHVAICCDAKTNWRRERSDTYKAGRMERPPEAWAQLDHVRETLQREGFPVWCVEGYEADDLIASAVAQARALEAPPDRVLIVTSDKDLLALLTDGPPTVELLTLGDQKKGPQLVRAADCAIEGVKLAPNRVRDFLALTGDGSDNVPGVRGIGPKKAQDLLAAYGSFPGVMAALEGEDERLKKSPLFKMLTDQKATAALSWDLVALRDDAPLEIGAAFVERVALPKEPATTIAGDGDEAIEGEPVSGDRGRVDGGAPMAAPMADEPRESRALATLPTDWRLACEPMSFGRMWDAARMVANSRMFPQLKTPEQVCAAMMLGRAHGITAIQACQNIYVVKGRATMAAQLIIGLVERSPLCEYIECVEADATKATWETKRKNSPRIHHVTFTIEQANRAGYTKVGPDKEDGSWQKDPETMLVWRAGTRLARRVYPGVIAGLYSVEEMTDEERSEGRAA